MRNPIQKWNYEEKVLFKQLVKIYGIDFEQYLKHFGNRTKSQIKSFYYAHLVRKTSTVSKQYTTAKQEAKFIIANKVEVMREEELQWMELDVNGMQCEGFAFSSIWILIITSQRIMRHLKLVMYCNKEFYDFYLRFLSRIKSGELMRFHTV